MSRIKLRQDCAQSDVKRGQQIVGLIHPAKPIEHHAKPTTSVRTFKGEAERKQEKANASYENRRGDCDKVAGAHDFFSQGALWRRCQR